LDNATRSCVTEAAARSGERARTSAIERRWGDILASIATVHLAMHARQIAALVD
jgi:hypothetical protein